MKQNKKMRYLYKRFCFLLGAVSYRFYHTAKSADEKVWLTFFSMLATGVVSFTINYLFRNIGYDLGDTYFTIAFFISFVCITLALLPSYKYVSNHRYYHIFNSIRFNKLLLNISPLINILVAVGAISIITDLLFVPQGWKITKRVMPELTLTEGKPRSDIAELTADYAERHLKHNRELLRMIPKIIDQPLLSRQNDTVFLFINEMDIDSIYRYWHFYDCNITNIVETGNGVMVRNDNPIARCSTDADMDTLFDQYHEKLFSDYHISAFISDPSVPYARFAFRYIVRNDSIVAIKGVYTYKDNLIQPLSKLWNKDEE